MKRQMVLLGLLSLLLVSGVFGAYYGYSGYDWGYGGGVGFGSLSNYFDLFINFIEENEYVIDAITFLVIFLILSKKVFGTHFAQDKLLYVVVGIALTIGIMVYERRTLQGSLIVRSGWLSLLVLLGFAAFMVYQTGGVTSMKILILSILWMVVLYIFKSIEFPLVQDLVYRLGEAYDFLYIIGGLGVIVGIIGLLFFHKKSG